MYTGYFEYHGKMASRLSTSDFEKAVLTLLW